MSNTMAKSMKGGKVNMVPTPPKKGGAITMKAASTNSNMDSMMATMPTMAKMGTYNGGSKKSSKKTKKTKKSKKPMPKGFAYCLICGKQTEMLNPETRTTKNGRKQMVGKGKCGDKVYRFI